MMSRINFFKYLSTIAITCLALYFLFRGVHFSQLHGSFFIDWRIVALTMTLFFIIKLLNTLRFSKIYRVPPSKELFSVLCYCNMLLSIFPLRLGEFSYISKLKGITKTSYSETASKLIKIRLFDYLSIYLLLMASSVYVYSNFSNVIQIVSGFFLVSLVGGLGGLFLIVKLGLSKKIKNVKISKILNLIEVEIRNNSRINFLDDAYILAVSLSYWSTRLLMGYLILNMLGLNLSFFAASFISLAVFMLGLIPIQFFAGFGLTEAGFLFFLIQLGFKYDPTLIAILAYHIYLLAPVVVYGVMGLVGSRRSS